MKIKYLILFCFLGLFVSCSKTPTHEMHLTATLRDGGKIIVDVILVFENEEGVAEFKDKSDQIQRAFRLILKDYKGSQFKEEHRATITKILRRIFNSMTTSKVIEIQYKHYEIQAYEKPE